MEFVTSSDKSKKEKLCLLMEQHEKPLLRMCYAYLKDASAAQDAVQECFLKAYRSMDSFRGESSERTWLCSIAMNVCRNMRRTAWFRHVDTRVDFDALPLSVEPRSDEDVALMDAVMRLPARYLEVVWLYYFEDMNISEISQLRRISASTVSRRLGKAKALLRDALKGEDMHE